MFPVHWCESINGTGKLGVLSIVPNVLEIPGQNVEFEWNFFCKK